MRALVVVGLWAGMSWAQAPQLEAQRPGRTRLEFSLAPAVVQLNGNFTQHVGTFATVSWRVRERLALQVMGGGNWYDVESGFAAELPDKFKLHVQEASTLLWTWGLFAGFEVEPFVGELTLFDGPRARVGFVLGVGAGVGGTRHQLNYSGETPATYGDTGSRFMATVTAGLRLQLGAHFTARLELRDVGYLAQVTTVNGCDLGDLTRADGQLRTGRTPDWGYGSPACRGFDRPYDTGVALSLVQQRSTDVLHNLGLSVGAGFVF
jgi:hypothetical protein